MAEDIYRPAATADSRGIPPFTRIPLSALNQLPAQTFAALQFLPTHCLEQAQGLENRPGVLLVQSQQVGLKFRVVEVELNN